MGFALPPARARSWTGVIDGEVVALGGYWFLPSGAAVAFLDLKPEAREKGRVTLMKTARMVLDDVRERGISTLIAMPDKNIDSAERFLTRLGFVQSGLTGEVYEWRA